MPIVTLTTDWGLNDHHAAILKGMLMAGNPLIRVVDISHTVRHHDQIGASFLIKQAFPFFPEGSIHLFGVGSALGYSNGFGLVFYKGQYFIGADNGIFKLIFEDEPEAMVYLNAGNPKSTFPEGTVMVPAILKLTAGSPIQSLGQPIDSLWESWFQRPEKMENQLRLTIRNIDDFGNAVLNITRFEFEKESLGRPFVLRHKRGEYAMDKISESYDEVIGDDTFCIFNSSGMLEFGFKGGSAKQLFGITPNDPVFINFINH